MADIFVTDKCNLKCSYCFAKEHVNKNKSEISIGNFNKAINFITNKNAENISICGGEPTLHTKFRDILQLVKNNNKINNCIIFTNGIELYKFVEEFENTKFSALINCNSKNDIGKKQFEKMKISIELLSQITSNFNIGINLYSIKQDYTYIFELLKSVNKHSLRFSLSVPNSIKEKEKNIIYYFQKTKPFLNKFFNDCLNREIVPYNDCNSIPPCILDNNDKKIQLKSQFLSKQYNLNSNLINSTFMCNVSVTIFPDLTASRSMCFPNCEKISIERFSSIEQIKKYFFNTVDIYTNLVFFREECKKCNYRLQDKCGICRVYKLKQAEKIKDYILNYNL